MRSLISFILFNVALVASFAFFMSNPTPQPQKISSKKSVPKVTQKLFYQTVGNSPKKTHSTETPLEHVYTIELGHYKSIDKAEAYLQNLRENGIQAFYTPYRSKSGDISYRIRRGVFSSEANAKKIALNLHQKKIKAKVIRLN